MNIDTPDHASALRVDPIWSDTHRVVLMRHYKREARRATPLRISTIACVAIAVFAGAVFAAQIIRAVVS